MLLGQCWEDTKKSLQLVRATLAHPSQGETSWESPEKTWRPGECLVDLTSNQRNILDTTTKPYQSHQ